MLLELWIDKQGPPHPNLTHHTAPLQHAIGTVGIYQLADCGLNLVGEGVTPLSASQ